MVYVAEREAAASSKKQTSLDPGIRTGVRLDGAVSGRGGRKSLGHVCELFIRLAAMASAEVSWEAETFFVFCCPLWALPDPPGLFRRAERAEPGESPCLFAFSLSGIGIVGARIRTELAHAGVHGLSKRSVQL